MREWYFSGVDTEGKQFSFKVKARDKKTAIDLGFQRLRKSGRNSIKWECHLKSPAW